ncbi:MAG: HD domain-containing protein [Deltaproteobacteria bacterium]|nr:HD domain-containing protein [Deltaproteobacteria bacterium]
MIIKKTFVKDIKEKDKIEDIFLVSKKEQGMSKIGKPYLNVKLLDKTGEIEARVWDDVENISKIFEKNDFVFVKAYAVAYQGGLQINISQIEKKTPETIDIKLFLPASKNDPDTIFKELEKIISTVKDNHLKKLLQIFTSDPEIARLLKLAPAAKSMHHTYIGGLLEHTVSLARLVIDISRHYHPNVHQDLLLAGAILHDMGKIYELSYERAFDYTDEGRLLGHITIGVEMLDKKIAEMPDFPKETAMLLKHMILSHHGYLEFGSPKRPKTIEAIILYYLDDMDSKVQSMGALIEKEKDADSKWTSFHKLYERYIYKGAGGIVSNKPQENETSDIKQKKDTFELFKK